MQTTAIIVAAGAGVRMGGRQPKAFLDLEGCPLVEHSLRLFQRHAEVDAIILMVPRGWVEAGRALSARYPKVVAVGEGGSTRRETVALGLERLEAPAGSPRTEHMVVVHDAARPLATAGLVTSVLEAARRTGAAVPGIAPADTVREVAGSRETRMKAGLTLDRQRLVLVQTPQAFRLDVLAAAHAGHQGPEPTDDAALVERIGHEVEVVPGSERNFKITGPDDLERAAWLMRKGD